MQTKHLCVGFLLLRYSILCTVEILSLLFSFLYLDLYVFGDDALISYGSIMQTKHLCVSTTSELRVRLAP